MRSGHRTQADSFHSQVNITIWIKFVEDRDTIASQGEIISFFRDAFGHIVGKNMSFLATLWVNIHP